jgi:DNA repair exonuclease SbcCD ATPase subunit
MTEAQKELYAKTKYRFRRLGKENPADVIVALAEEIDRYRSTIGGLEKELAYCQEENRLLEADIAERDKMLEQKVEEVYPEFMRDYKAIREELESVCEELPAARDALERLTHKKPEMKAMEGFTAAVASHLCCPNCGEPVTNYWAPGSKPKHCQFCGQALDWGEGAQVSDT